MHAAGTLLLAVPGECSQHAPERRLLHANFVQSILHSLPQCRHERCVVLQAENARLKEENLQLQAKVDVLMSQLHGQVGVPVFSVEYPVDRAPSQRGMCNAGQSSIACSAMHGLEPGIELLSLIWLSCGVVQGKPFSAAPPAEALALPQQVA